MLRIGDVLTSPDIQYNCAFLALTSVAHSNNVLSRIAQDSEKQEKNSERGQRKEWSEKHSRSGLVCATVLQPRWNTPNSAANKN